MPATHTLASAWPRPGPLWGPYPERRAPEPGAHAPRFLTFGRESRYRELGNAARAAAREWGTLGAAAHQGALVAVRLRLAREGLACETLAHALGGVADTARRTLGTELFDTQLFAAAVLLEGSLAEMATGEGKTLAAAAAAGVAALAGVPVHVITANDYLVTRDAQMLEPYYAALGLTVGTIESGNSRDARRAAYACDVVYCTARELVFDYLRDRQIPGVGRSELERRAAALSAQAPAQPLLRGLCMAIIDEADSSLLDEATVPLILSETRNDPAHRAELWQALGIARQLHAGEHYRLDDLTRAAELTPAGCERTAALAAALAGAWRSRRRREELACTALAALNAYHRNHDYLVRDGRVEIIDRVTGRTVPGRVWSRGLQGLIELKEGCRVTGETRTIAQITYQRFFPRYLRLAGMSGTLREARRELAATYGLQVIPVPLRVPLRRVRLPTRMFHDSTARWDAVAERVAGLRAQARPVLIGTDSVEASEALSQRLTAEGIAHALLNARHDRAEAEIVARAGEPGAVTVATNMAGRGTDIVLGPGVEAAGGLHIISCQHNTSRRLDRQLEGRSARQGDSGSVEHWLALDSALFAGGSLGALCRRIAARDAQGPFRWASALAQRLARVPQLQHEWRDAAQRRRLGWQDRQWARGGAFVPRAE